MRRIRAVTISGAYVALMAACASEPLATCDTTHSGPAGVAAQPATCADWTQKLIDCDVLGGTRVSGCSDDDVRLPCIWDCTEKATCTQIERWYCKNEFNSYAGCLNECHMVPLPFKCDDGSQIELTQACDGTPDCPNGEDEDCTQGFFGCEDGTQIPESWQCDGVVQCSGGEDETGCPPGPMYTCADGSTIDASLECNGVEDCTGGDDEVNCAVLLCE